MSIYPDRREIRFFVRVLILNNPLAETGPTKLEITKTRRTDHLVWGWVTVPVESHTSAA